MREQRTGQRRLLGASLARERRISDRRGEYVRARDQPAWLPPGAALMVPSTRIAQHAEEARVGRLVKRAQAGDSEALAELYRLYIGALRAYLSTRLINRADAEDGAQEVFLRATRALTRYDERGTPFRAWLFTIAANFARDERRRSAVARAWSAAIADQQSASPPFVEPPPALEPGVLGHDEAAVLLLRYWLDLPFAEIAARLSRNAADVRQIHHRALAKLRTSNG